MGLEILAYLYNSVRFTSLLMKNNISVADARDGVNLKCILPVDLAWEPGWRSKRLQRRAEEKLLAVGKESTHADFCARPLHHHVDNFQLVCHVFVTVLHTKINYFL